MHTSHERHIGRLATSAVRRLLHRDRFQELIAQTRRELERELADLESHVESARIERNAAELRHRQRAAETEARRDEIKRRLANL